MSFAARPTSGAPAATGRAPPLFVLWISLAGVILGALGLLWYFADRQETVNNVYGQRQGEGADSVSGTSVLAEMIRRRGSRVTVVHRLSPRLNRFDVIFWFPDDFQPPTNAQREWLEDWLSEGYSPRTVVYVGRDFDAAVRYWDDVAPAAPAGQKDEIKRRWAKVKSEYDSQRLQMPEERHTGWFVQRRDQPRVQVQTLSGPWAEGIDAKKTSLTLAGRLEKPEEKTDAYSEPVPETVETLLASDKDDLALRLSSPRFGSGQVIVLANGSFVLNYPLVNHEHRKLAARLLDDSTPDGSEVAFLESRSGGPPINTADEENETIAQMPYPLNAVLYHAAVLLVVACLAFSPIFGRPLELPRESLSDFGKHIRALGKLLQRTKDSAYAFARLQQYRQHAKRDSGKSHAK